MKTVKRLSILFIFCGLLLAAVLYQPLPGSLVSSAAMAADEIPAMRAKRHKAFLQDGIPLEYRSRKNPYPPTTFSVRDGGELYRAHCLSCHGETGKGDGEASLDLSTPPAMLDYMIQRPRSVDEYLLWTISEGGARFGTEMPAFSGRLSEDQIWKIVTYMRDTFPAVGTPEQD